MDLLVFIVFNEEIKDIGVLCKVLSDYTQIVLGVSVHQINWLGGVFLLLSNQLCSSFIQDNQWLFNGNVAAHVSFDFGFVGVNFALHLVQSASELVLFVELLNEYAF